MPFVMCCLVRDIATSRINEHVNTQTQIHGNIDSIHPELTDV